MKEERGSFPRVAFYLGLARGLSACNGVLYCTVLYCIVAPGQCSVA